MKTRKTSKKKSLKRPVQVSDESEIEQVNNEDELATNENQSPNGAASSTSLKQEALTQNLGTKAKRRKVPDKSSDDSSSDSSSTDTKANSPEHDSNITNPEIIDKAPLSPVKIVRSPSIEVLQTNFEKIELTKSDSADHNDTRSDLSVDKQTEPETTVENICQRDEQTNASQAETAAFFGFPELSLDFEEASEQLEIPEFVEDRVLKTPEISGNYEEHFPFAEAAEESKMQNHSTSEEWEERYLNQSNTLQYSEDLAEEYESTREDYGEHGGYVQGQYEGGYELAYGANENMNEYEPTREESEVPMPQYEYKEGEELSQYKDNVNFNHYESTREDYEAQKYTQCKGTAELGCERNENADKYDTRRENCEEATSQSEKAVDEAQSAQSEDADATRFEANEKGTTQSEADSSADSEKDSETESESPEESEDDESEKDESTSESEEETNKSVMQFVQNIDNNDQLKLETSKELDEIKIETKENEKEESTTAHTEYVKENKEPMTTSLEALFEESSETLCSKESQKKSPNNSDNQDDELMSKLRTELSVESESAGAIKQADNLQTVTSEEDKMELNESLLANSIDMSPDSKKDSNSDQESDSFSSISFGHSEDNMSSHSPTMKVEGLDIDLNSLINSPKKKPMDNIPTEDYQDESVATQSNEKPAVGESQVREPLSFIAEAMQMITQDADKSNNSGNEENVDGLPSAVNEKKNSFEESMMNFLTTMPQKSAEQEQKPATAADIVFPTALVKESDSDDSNWQRKSKALKTETNSGKDFFEDDSTYEEEKNNTDDEEEELRPNAESTFVVVLNDYEVMFHEIRKLVEKVPNRYKYELHNLLFPIMAIGYLRMIFNGKYRKGKAFVENSQRYLDYSYVARIEKLIGLQSGASLPKKARSLLGDENEQLGIPMYADTYRVLVLHMKSWTRSLQQTFVRHFDLLADNNITEPRQHAIIGAATPEKIFWANPESLKEKKENSPPSRRKRFKNFKPSPTRNANLPTCTRLYTPTPKRWDLEQIKEDEERRVPLNRENLPSAYLYTAIEHVETVICASFSNNLTMLSIGTNCSTIHVYSLTSSKLVHIKPADYLKHLDTGMSGIDESMLDASKKKMRRTLVGHQGPVYGCTFAPHDRFLLSCAHDRTVRCWCLLSWSCVVIYPGHASAVYGVCYAPLGYYFATVSDDRTARVWVQDNKKSLCILVGHLAEVICCVFHPNRHYLATGSGDCTVRMWDIVKAVQVRVFSGHREPVNTLAYSICGRYLVSGADDKYIVVWDTEREQLVRALSYHTEAINCLQFAMDNKLFVAGGQDCQLSIWDFELIVQEYDAERMKPTSSSSKTEKPETKPPKQSVKERSGEVLVQSYPSKGTPFYMLHITRRNLLLGFCVQRLEDLDKESGKQSGLSESKYREWREFLDILKLKACFANGEQRAGTQQDIKEEEGSSSDQELETSIKLED